MGGGLGRRLVLAWRAPSVLQRLESRETQQRATALLGQRALAGEPLTELLPEAVRTVSEVLSLPIANILRSVDGGPFSFVAVHGWDKPLGTLAKPSGGPLERLLDSGGTLVVEDTESLSEPALTTFRGLGLRSSACVLATSRGGSRWVLLAHARTPHAFAPDDTAFLRAIANIVAAAAAREEAEAAAHTRATHDPLTGLADRELFREQLQRRLHTAPGTPQALLLVDLDGFKDVNDSYGHSVGDQVLRVMADRLTSVAGTDGLACRLGGDEFALALPVSRLAAHPLVQSLSELMRVPVETPAGAVALSGSVGVAVHPGDGTTVTDLLKQSDLAMYRAKRDRSPSAWYDRRLDPDPAARMRAVHDLREAIADGSITVAYQPCIDLASGRVTTVEALARWNHPTLGPQSPSDFVELAEQTGLIRALTDHVIDVAAAQTARWHAEGRGFAVAVNIPGSVLDTDGYPDQLRRQIAQTGLPLDLLRIEVTETALVNDDAVAALRSLSADGIRIAIDDFGTGYSSLGRIKALPVNTIKIDRSFVTFLGRDSQDTAIVRAVVALATDLGLNVIAEGVETQDVEDRLRRLGVPRVQGFLYSKALPAKEFATWHDAQRSALMS